MKTNKEIREEAWNLLGHERWIWRLLGAGIILTSILALVLIALNVLFANLGVESLGEFQKAKLQALASGLDYTSPSSTATFRMWSAALFQSFMQGLFSGIASLGFAAVLLKAARREQKGILSAAFGGFRAPFGTFWVLFSVQVRTWFWLMATFVPALVVVGGLVSVLGAGASGVAVLASVPAALVLLWVVYRYLLVWFVRADQPELSASACIARSVALMRGNKMRAIGLDCSFWPWFLLLAVAFLPLAWPAYVELVDEAPLTTMQLGISAISLLIGGLLLVWVGWYVAVAHAVFYREVAAGAKHE